MYLWEGLTTEHAAAVFAHELGHVHMFTSHFPALAAVDEEGLCELLCSLWLEKRASRARLPEDDSLARVRLEAMRANTDPVYGEGLRRARAALTARAGDVSRLFDDTRRAGRIPHR